MATDPSILTSTSVNNGYTKEGIYRGVFNASVQQRKLLLQRRPR